VLKLKLPSNINGDVNRPGFAGGHLV